MSKKDEWMISLTWFLQIGETNFVYNDAEHSREPLSWPDRIKVAIGAAKGLLHLHESNIIHRDMRPSNILVTHDYEAMVIKHIVILNTRTEM